MITALQAALPGVWLSRRSARGRLPRRKRENFGGSTTKRSLRAIGPSSNHAENGEGAGESDIESEGVSRGCFPSSNSPYDIQQLAAPGKFEVKRLGALEHSNDGMAVSSSGYSVSNFAGSANSAMG